MVARFIALAALAHLAVAAACDRAPPPSRPADDQWRPDPGEPLRPPSERGTIPDDAHVVDYVMTARLDAEEHRIDGTATITWTNTSSIPIDAIPFHLYLNGFRAENTAWMRDGRLSSRTSMQGGKHPWGYIDVASVSQRQPAPGSDGAQTVALSFAERDEPSLMDVQLATPVAPGQTVTLELSWVTQLPHVFARSGYGGDFHMVAQWFPKPGVLGPDGRWRAHPFTFHSEFYADFGDYEVELDVPYTMAVGATGIRTASATEGERRLLTYRAQMVHDFAWTAGQNLVEQTREHEGISIRQLIPPDRAADGPAHLDIAVATLDHMQRRFSPYPWSTLTIIHPPPYAAGAGGMEYPTLFTTGDRERLPPGADALGFSERFSGLYVTAHELGHQWFQGLLASDEFAQPWLDEGLNSFSNALVYFDHYADEEIAGEDVWIASVGGQRLTLGDGLRLRQRWRSAQADVSDQTAADFDPLHGEYGVTTYRRTSAWMLTLRAIAGRDRFDAAMRTYADRFRFRHPTGADLEDVLVEGLGDTVALSQPDANGRTVQLDVRKFLDQALRTSASVDFDVDGILVLPRVSEDAPAGWHRDDQGELVGGQPPPSRSRRAVAELPDADVESTVVVRRRGDFIVPVVIALHTDDGTERVVWDGRKPAITLRRPGMRIRSVVVDPDGDIYLEGTRNNNTSLARDVAPPRGLPGALGDLTEVAALAVLGGVGP